MKKYFALILALIFVFLPLTNAFADFEWPIKIDIDETGYEIEYQYLVPDLSIGDDSGLLEYLEDLFAPVLRRIMLLEFPYDYILLLPLYPVTLLIQFIGE